MSTPAAAARHQWMDLLRGVAILLVLLWHAPAIPVHAGGEMPDWLRSVNDAFMPYRMPTLMFLSGMLLPRSLRKPLPAYMTGKLRMLVWPYLLWAAVHMLLYESTAPMWHPRAWIATGYLWFVFFLAVYYVVAPALRRVHPGVISLVAFAASVPASDRLLERLLYFAGFFFAGAVVGRDPRWLDRLVASRTAVVLCLVAATGFAVYAAGNDTQFRAEFAVLSLAGIVAAVWGARRVGEAPSLRPVRFIGRNSIVFYVTHFPVMYLVLLALGAVGVRELWVVAPLGLAASVVVASLLAHRRDVVPIRWMFEAPRLSSGGPRARAGRAVVP